MNIFLFLISSLIFLACTESQSPEDYAKSLTIKTSPSTVIKVKRPMKFGEKLACNNWIDLGSLEKAFAMPLTLKDESAKKKETSSSCSIRNNQKRPKKTKKKKTKLTQGDQILGVTPGDELCLMSLYCSYVSTENSLKKRCTQEQDEETTISGQFACVHKTQRGSRWAYTYRTIDTDTTCMLTIQGGPSVTDETTVRTCTYFALKHLTKESLTQQPSSNTDQKQ